MSLNEAGQQQQQQQDQVAGRSSITIRVGASSTTPDTPSSGSDGPVSSEAQINSSPAHPASDVDAGRHGNSSQQRKEGKRSSVNITVMHFSFILVDGTFKGISQVTASRTSHLGHVNNHLVHLCFSASKSRDS